MSRLGLDILKYGGCPLFIYIPKEKQLARELFMVIEMTLFAKITVVFPAIVTEEWNADTKPLAVAEVTYVQNHTV
jgi:hypothetical protein